MATELFMKRRLSSLVPTNRMSEELLRDLPEHVTLKIVATQPRNPKHHAKFMALIAAIYPHQSIYPTMESFRKAITVALGYGDTVKLPDGRVMLIPGSISFAKMDQRAFEEFYERAVHLILTRVLPGADRPDLEREVMEILEGRARDSA